MTTTVTPVNIPMPAQTEVHIPTQGFSVPPAGKPIALPNQQEGWVNQQQAAVQPLPVQAQAQPQQIQMDEAGIAALIQKALQGQPTEQVAPVEKPSWMPEDLNAFDVAGIQDPIIKSMATILQGASANLDLTRVLSRALSTGDVSLIDYAYLHEKGGANAAHLAEISKGIVQAVSAKADAVTSEIHTLVGGEANWTRSTAVFNQSAPQELRVTVARMLDSTDDSIIKAGAKIVAEFGRQSGQLPQLGTGLLQNNVAVGAGSSGLSKTQFQAELNKLKPDTQGYYEAREALFARRSLGKQIGL